jgi:hypothetical protein
MDDQDKNMPPVQKPDEPNAAPPTQDPAQSPQNWTQPPQPGRPISSPDPFASMIPSQNKSGLIAYYLGLFSILPIIGLPMGIVAVVQGVKGNRLAKEHPEVKGGTHAKVGIGCGLIGALFNLAIVLFILYLLLNPPHPSY